MKSLVRTFLFLLSGGAIVGGLVWSFWPQPVLVEIATVGRGPLRRRGALGDLGVEVAGGGDVVERRQRFIDDVEQILQQTLGSTHESQGGPLG